MGKAVDYPWAVLPPAGCGHCYIFLFTTRHQEPGTAGESGSGSGLPFRVECTSVRIGVPISQPTHSLRDPWGQPWAWSPAGNETLHWSVSLCSRQPVWWAQALGSSG